MPFYMTQRTSPQSQIHGNTAWLDGWSCSVKSHNKSIEMLVLQMQQIINQCVRALGFGNQCKLNKPSITLAMYSHHQSIQVNRIRRCEEWKSITTTFIYKACIHNFYNKCYCWSTFIKFDFFNLHPIYILIWSWTCIAKLI
jgi:hypothetical protein